MDGMKAIGAFLLAFAVAAAVAFIVTTIALLNG
jgi:hypothetical protein